MSAPLHLDALPEAGAEEGASDLDVYRLLSGDTRTDDQIARDGARLTISQIDKLRRQLDQAERDCQHVIRTGNAKKDSDAIWKRVAKAADKLLAGMVA